MERSAWRSVDGYLSVPVDNMEIKGSSLSGKSGSFGNHCSTLYEGKQELVLTNIPLPPPLAPRTGFPESQGLAPWCRDTGEDTVGSAVPLLEAGNGKPVARE